MKKPCFFKVKVCWIKFRTVAKTMWLMHAECSTRKIHHPSHTMSSTLCRTIWTHLFDRHESSFRWVITQSYSFSSYHCLITLITLSHNHLINSVPNYMNTSVRQALIYIPRSYYSILLLLLLPLLVHPHLTYNHITCVDQNVIWYMLYEGPWCRQAQCRTSGWRPS
jgi:hypothetical protein